MSHGDIADEALAENRLGVALGARAGGAVTGVADGHMAREGGQDVLVEDLADEAHIFVHSHEAPVADGEAGALLASMLKREEAEEG